MSYPSIPESMTREQFEAHMKQAKSSVYIEDGGEVVAVVHYDYGYPTTPWVYDYFGVCGMWEAPKDKKASTEKKDLRCTTWVHEPYVRRFAQLDDLSFWLAFVGLEYS